jgi:hypothetical protein
LSYKEISAALIPTARSGGLHFNRRLVTRALHMENGDAWVLHWRQSIVEVLVVAATFALAFAATNTPGDVPFMLLVAGALVGTGLILEPRVTVPRPGEIGPQPLRLRQELEPALPETDRGHFDGAIVDAAVA